MEYFLVCVKFELNSFDDEVQNGEHKPLSCNEQGLLCNVDLTHAHGSDFEYIVDQDDEFNKGDDIPHVVCRIVEPVFNVVELVRRASEVVEPTYVLLFQRHDYQQIRNEVRKQTQNGKRNDDVHACVRDHSLFSLHSSQLKFVSEELPLFVHCLRASVVLYAFIQLFLSFSPLCKFFVYFVHTVHSLNANQNEHESNVVEHNSSCNSHLALQINVLVVSAQNQQL